MIKLQSMGEENAIKLAETKWWIGKSARCIAEFQMLTEELCCPFQIFHEALEKTLGRPIYTHEMALNYQGLLDELFNDAKALNFEDILNLIPKDKKIILL